VKIWAATRLSIERDAEFGSSLLEIALGARGCRVSQAEGIRRDLTRKPQDAIQVSSIF